MIEDMVYQCRFSCSSDGKKGNILLVPDGVDDFITLLFPVTEVFPTYIPFLKKWVHLRVLCKCS